MKPEFVIVSGNASRDLATAVAQLLDTEIGKCRVERFPDTEVNVRLDEPVRERRVFIIQSSCPPVDERAMEVFAIADACRRAAASAISWIAPYFGYGRSDKRRGRRTAVMGKVMADFAEHVGIDHVIAVDLHSRQVEGFFHVPVENLTAVFALAEALKPHLESGSVIVSPDTGGVKLASAYASRLGCPVAVLHKERLNGTETVVSRVVGEVRGRPCVIVDDMISTGGTIKSAIETLIQAGSREHFIVAATHPVFTPQAQKNLKSIGHIIVTNSIPFSANDWPNVQTVSLAPLLAAAIRRSTAGESMANLFQGVIHGGE